MEYPHKSTWFVHWLWLCCPQNTWQSHPVSIQNGTMNSNLWFWKLYSTWNCRDTILHFTHMAIKLKLILQWHQISLGPKQTNILLKQTDVDANIFALCANLVSDLANLVIYVLNNYKYWHHAWQTSWRPQHNNMHSTDCPNFELFRPLLGLKRSFL